MPIDPIEFPADDLARARCARCFERVVDLGGSVVHLGERRPICRDSEGSPLGLGVS